jgi:hypothetical protein
MKQQRRDIADACVVRGQSIVLCILDDADRLALNHHQSSLHRSVQTIDNNERRFASDWTSASHESTRGMSA